MIDIPDNIFPVNERGERLCFKCKKVIGECVCLSFDPSKPKFDLYVPVVRIDKKGRNGKVVVVVEGLPNDEGYLKELAKKLKTKTGSGGTYFISGDQGFIEVQGSKNEIIVEILRSEGFKI